MKATAALRSRGRVRGCLPCGFTLVELLVVVAIMAVLSTLMVPAVRGLVGVGGRRGGMNTVASTIEKARLAAIESGVTTYVGFPFGVADTSAAYSSVIVLASEGNSLAPLSRWVRMPAGIFIDIPNSQSLTSVAPGGSIPKLATSNGVVDVSQLKTLAFDRFGRLTGNEPVEIRVGEKADPGGDFLKGANNCFSLTVHPLTGRVTVKDLSANSAP